MAELRKAMVFAAGLGTRLRPLTNDRPKALVELDGMSLLEFQLRKMYACGIREVVVNIHHFAEAMTSFLEQFSLPGLHIHISDERDAVLETGGGLWKARHWLEGEEDIFVCNVDVISDLDPRALHARHQESEAIATLAVRDRKTSRYLVWDESMRLRAWRNVQSGEERGHCNGACTQLAFSGMQILSPEIFRHIHQRGKFSIIDVYLQLAEDGLVAGLRHDADYWMDVGKPEQLAAAAGKAAEILDRFS